MASSDSLRVGDAEREAVAAELREHYAQGRLSIEDFNERIDAAYAARTRADLDRLTRDLPHARPPGAPLPAPHPGSRRQHWHGPLFGPDGAGFGYGERRRTRFGQITNLLAALASLLIVFDLMAGLAFPWPGRVGVLVAVFAVIRGLLRRIFGFMRRR
jgi:uncharacterized protein DUF1707